MNNNLTYEVVKKEVQKKIINYLYQNMKLKRETKTLAQWSEELGIKKTTLHNRLNYYSWTIDRALGGK